MELNFWSVRRVLKREIDNCLSDIILDDIFGSARHRSAGEESICPCLVHVCGVIGEGQLGNDRKLVW